MHDIPKIVIIDFETTSLSNNREATQIGLVALDLELNELARYESLVNPQVAPSRDALDLTGISLHDIHSAPRIEELWGEISRFFSNSVLVMHNNRFDLQVIENDFVQKGLIDSLPPSMCTLELAQELLSKDEVGGSFRLQTLCDYFEIVNERAHSALADAAATTQLLLELIDIDESILDELQVLATTDAIDLSGLRTTYRSTDRRKGNVPNAVAPGVVRDRTLEELQAIADEIATNPKSEYVVVTGNLTIPFPEFDRRLRPARLYWKETPPTMKTAFLVVGAANSGGSKIEKAIKYRRPVVTEKDAYRLIEILISRKAR